MLESKRAVSAFAEYIENNSDTDNLTCPCIAFCNERFYEVPVRISYKEDHYFIDIVDDINHTKKSFKTKKNKFKFHHPSSLTIFDDHGNVLLTPIM